MPRQLLSAGQPKKSPKRAKKSPKKSPKRVLLGLHRSAGFKKSPKRAKKSPRKRSSRKSGGAPHLALWRAAVGEACAKHARDYHIPKKGTKVYKTAKALYEKLKAKK